MPIYAYKCASCGHQLDVLQKIADAPLTQCPECGAPALAKQLTAAGFQLKGSGWYVTDFRSNGSGKSAEAKSDKASGDKPGGDKATGEAAKSGDGTSDKSSAKLAQGSEAPAAKTPDGAASKAGSGSGSAPAGGTPSTT